MYGNTNVFQNVEDKLVQYGEIKRHKSLKSNLGEIVKINYNEYLWDHTLQHF